MPAKELASWCESKASCEQLRATDSRFMLTGARPLPLHQDGIDEFVIDDGVEAFIIAGAEDE